MYKKTDDYQTPGYDYQGKTHDTLDNSFSQSQSSSVGVSWIKDNVVIGAAYSERKDKYGLPAHSHLYDECHARIISNEAKMAKPYLRYYPFLLEETNVDYANPGLERKK